MLERLRISGFAVARAIECAPGPGLNVFTGETGAGKSLVVDALAFLFGARRGREVVGAGHERALVDALVRLDGRSIALERSVGLAGRSLARRDGEPATLDDIQALGARAIDIHGQSEQLAILRPAVQLAMLDEFAGLGPARQELAPLVRELRELRRQLRSHATDARERERLIEQLQFEAEEIASAALLPGEDHHLRREQARLANAGRLLAEASAAIEALASPALGEAIRAVDQLTARDESAPQLADLALLLETTAADLGRALRQYREALDEDPGRLAHVEERLDRIARLRRKYGETIEDVLAYGEAAAARLAALAGAESSREEVAVRAEGLLRRAAEAAAHLSRARRIAAGRLVAALAAELERLAMPGAALSLGFACDDAEDGLPVAAPDYELVAAGQPQHSFAGEPFPRAFTESGVDRVEFRASFNPGEPARPLASIASGGEASRFLLALATVLGAAAEPRIVVFDEVDEGVGGRAGALVGEALARLARRHQVLCVTHLPQVAAYGARHFAVTKRSDAMGTWSEIRELEGDARLAELAAMLGETNDANLEAALAMLAAAAAATRTASTEPA